MKLNSKHIILSAIFSALWVLTFANDTIVVEEVGEFVCLSVDAKKNFYVADNQHTLYKIDSSGNIITNVNTKIYGEINKIDCTNPFEIYTYHKDQNVVVFYDNMLNQRGIIRLNDIYLNNVAAIARTYDNGVWVYDVSEYKLLKINKLGEIVTASFNLMNLIHQEMNVFDIQEIDKGVYLIDSSLGLIKFDLFATFDRIISISNLESACVQNDGFVGTKNGAFIKYAFLSKNYSIKKMNLPPVGIAASANKTHYTFTKNLIISIED